MAFVFDIDSVLVHGGRPIPEGKRVLEILNGDNELGIKIPHIFLTRGSGKPEQARVQQLLKILHSLVSVDQFIQWHTLVRALAKNYDTALVVSGEDYRCREVAEQYGFKDIVVSWPGIQPSPPTEISPMRGELASALVTFPKSTPKPSWSSPPPTCKSLWTCYATKTAA